MDLPKARPTDMGVCEASVEKLIDQFISGALQANAMVMSRHGVVVSEFFRTPFNAANFHPVASITKSIVSIATGFAIAEGLISVDDTVVSYFSDVVKPPIEAKLAKMKIEHLLTMTSGHLPDWEFQNTHVAGHEVINTILLTPLTDEPGEKFSYNTDGVNVLSQIIERASGVRFDKYVHDRLFAPLNIHHYIWEKELIGITNAGFGLHLRAQDLLKIGIMMLHNGEYDKKRILSAEYVARAGASLVDGGMFGHGYGYLFHRQAPEGSYMAQGGGGQYCLILPKQDMVIVLYDSNDKAVQAIWDIILPGLDNKSETKIDPSVLENKAKQIVIEMPTGERYNPAQVNEATKKYALESNSLGVTHISFCFDRYEMTLYENEKSCVCKIGYGEWLESDTYADPTAACTQHICGLHTPVSIAAAWEGDIFHMKQVYTTIGYIDDMYISFSNDLREISIDYKRNDKGFVDLDKVITGTA